MAVNLRNDSIFETNKQFIDSILLEEKAVQINEPTEEYQDFNKPFIDKEGQNREIINIDKRESNAYDIEVREKYETGAFTSGALPESQFSDPINIDRESVQNRISEVGDRLGVFLYNLIPYQALNAVSSVGAAIENPDIAGLLTSSAMTSLSGLQKLKYFTPAELALTLGHNFYTLHFLRGVTVKKGKSGGLGITGPASKDDVWNGEVDINFGRDSLPSFSFSQLQGAAANFIAGGQEISESGNVKLAQIKDGENGITPRITITPAAVIQRKKSSHIDQLSNENKMTQSARTDLMTTTLKDQDTIGTQWNGRDIFDEEDYTIEEIKNRQHETNQDEYLINPNVLNIAQRVNEASNIEWGRQNGEEDFPREEFAFRDVENRQHETNQDEYLINPNVLNIAQRVNEISGTKWVRQNNEEDFPLEEFTFRDVENRTWDTNRDNYLVNPNVLQIKVGPGDTEERGTPDNILKGKGFVEDRKSGAWQIGAVYVVPVVSESFTDLKRFSIPFEFNPEISENTIGARYQQTQVLSRIGDLQSYTGTNSLSLSLMTKYFAVAQPGYEAEGDRTGNFGNEWMSEFTLPKIQAIELAYRSLVYPHFPDEESIDTGYVYVKPPLIKVIMGDTINGSQTQPYANLLTYQTNSVLEGKFQNSEEKWGNPILRTFVATEVGIKKDLMNDPIYLDDKNTIRDTFGFEVTLSLTEVSPNYLDTMPDFKSRFQQYQTVMGEYVEGN